MVHDVIPFGWWTKRSWSCPRRGVKSFRRAEASPSELERPEERLEPTTPCQVGVNSRANIRASAPCPGRPSGPPSIRYASRSGPPGLGTMQGMSNPSPGRKPHGGRRITELRRTVWSTHPHVCWLCGEPIKAWREFEIDHVLPRSLGGTDSLANLRPAHGRLSVERCNQRRGNSVADARRPGAQVEQDNSSWFTQGR